MQFHTDGNIFKVVHVTGPTHNYLGLAFTKNNEEVRANVEPLVLNANEPTRLDSYEVERWVMQGVEKANHELATTYRVKTIQFVVSDSPPAEIYAQLAQCIIERMHASSTAYNE
jgi:hypothetical protein